MITRKQLECLRAIDQLTVDFVPPSYEELSEALGLLSKSCVHRMIHGLSERGFLITIPNRARAYEITYEGRAMLNKPPFKPSPYTQIEMIPEGFKGTAYFQMPFFEEDDCHAPEHIWIKNS